MSTNTNNPPLSRKRKEAKGQGASRSKEEVYPADLAPRIRLWNISTSTVGRVRFVFEARDNQSLPATTRRRIIRGRTGACFYQSESNNNYRSEAAVFAGQPFLRHARPENGSERGRTSNRLQPRGLEMKPQGSQPALSAPPNIPPDRPTTSKTGPPAGVPSLHPPCRPTCESAPPSSHTNPAHHLRFLFHPARPPHRAEPKCP